MITLEQVEKLRTYANVSYEDAERALSAVNGDMLEAVIYLEKAGKIEKPTNDGKFTTDDSDVAEKIFQEEKEKQEQKNGYNENVFRFDTRKIKDFIKEMFRISRVNYFEVTRKGEKIISIPVLILIVALLFFFWVTLPFMVIGLFFGCSYSFRGPNIKGNESPLNQAMGGAKSAAEQVKKAFDDYNKTASDDEEKN